MRIKIYFSGKSNILLPINYTHYLQALIYTHLPENISGFLHNTGFVSDNKKFNLFNFSKIFSENYEVKDKYIDYGNNAYFFFSSPIKDLVEIFANSILSKSKNNFIIGNTEINIDSIDTIKNYEIKKDKIIIARTLSPIAIKKTSYENDKKIELYLLPNNELFNDILLGNLFSKYKLLHKDSEISKNDIEIRFLKYKKVVRKYKKAFIDSIDAKLSIKTNQEIFNTIYDCGLGSKNSQGFGMIDIMEYK